MHYLFFIKYFIFWSIFCKKTSIYYLFSPRYGGPRKVYQKWQTSYPSRLHQMVPLRQSILVQNEVIPYCCSLRYLRLDHRNNWWSGKTDRCETFVNLLPRPRPLSITIHSYNSHNHKIWRCKSLLLFIKKSFRSCSIDSVSLFQIQLRIHIFYWPFAVVFFDNKIPGTNLPKLPHCGFAPWKKFCNFGRFSVANFTKS